MRLFIPDIIAFQALSNFLSTPPLPSILARVLSLSILIF